MSLSLSERVLKLSSSATIAMKSKAKSLQDSGVRVLDLSAGEPDFETPKLIVEAAKKALDKGVSRYTPGRGTDALVKAMQFKFERDQGVRYEASQVLSTVGAKAAVAMALDAVVSYGDEVIVLSPYWVSYPEMVRLAGGTPVFVSAGFEQGFVPNIDDIRRAITKKTKAVLLNTPGNPSGVVLDQSWLTQLMGLLEGSDIWLLSDEIYEHLVFDGKKHVSPASLSQDAYERTVVITGASKGYAMTGWRVGFVGGPKLIIDAMLKLQGQLYSCVAAICQAAAEYALYEDAALVREIEQMRDAYQARRDVALSLLSSFEGVRCAKPFGAFYVLPDFSSVIGKKVRGKTVVNDDDLAMRLLMEAHVATVAGSAFGAPNCLRLSLASAQSEIEEGLARIKSWLLE